MKCNFLSFSEASHTLSPKPPHSSWALCVRGVWFVNCSSQMRRERRDPDSRQIHLTIHSVASTLNKKSMLRKTWKKSISTPVRMSSSLGFPEQEMLRLSPQCNGAHPLYLKRARAPSGRRPRLIFSLFSKPLDHGNNNCRYQLLSARNSALISSLSSYKPHHKIDTSILNSQGRKLRSYEIW